MICVIKVSGSQALLSGGVCSSLQHAARAGLPAATGGAGLGPQWLSSAVTNLKIMRYHKRFESQRVFGIPVGGRAGCKLPAVALTSTMPRQRKHSLHPLSRSGSFVWPRLWEGPVLSAFGPSLLAEYRPHYLPSRFRHDMAIDRRAAKHCAAHTHQGPARGEICKYLE